MSLYIVVQPHTHLIFFISKSPAIVAVAIGNSKKKQKKNKSPKKWNIWLRKFNCKLWRGTMTVDAKHLAYYYYKLVITKLTWSYWIGRRYDSSSLGTWRERREGISVQRTLTTDQVIDRWNRAKLHSDPFFASLFSLSLSLFFGMYFKILTVPWQRHLAAMSSTAP